MPQWYFDVRVPATPANGYVGNGGARIPCVLCPYGKYSMIKITGIKALNTPVNISPFSGQFPLLDRSPYIIVILCSVVIDSCFHSVSGSVSSPVSLFYFIKKGI